MALPPMTPNHRAASHRVLRLAFVCVGLAGIVLFARLATLQGLFTWVCVSGGSMAEGFPGEQAMLACPACHFSFPVDLGPWDHDPHAICPNCRQPLEDSAEVSRRTGNRVLIDRAAYWMAGPQRFDVVAFHEPSHDELAVKRIIALPDERWELQRGDLFVQGDILRKTPQQFIATAVIVHDDSHRPAELVSRWKPTEESSGWHATPDGFRWERKGGKPKAGERNWSDWLLYHHAPHHPAAKVDESPVADVDAYNPSLARPLQTVTDVFLHGEFHLRAISELHFRIHDGYEHHELIYPVRTARGQSHSILCGLCDRTLWLVVDGAVVEKKELKVREDSPQTITRPLAIGGAGEGSIEIRSLCVLRDIHYLDPQGLADTWQPPQPLGEGEYAVLGDNSPLSIDSRHWTQPITRGSILGRVLKWEAKR